MSIATYRVFRGTGRYQSNGGQFTSCRQIVESKVGGLLYRSLNEEVHINICQMIRIDDDKMKVIPELRVTVNGQVPDDQATIDRLTKKALEMLLMLFRSVIPAVVQDACIEEAKGRSYILLKGYR